MPLPISPLDIDTGGGPNGGRARGTRDPNCGGGPGGTPIGGGGLGGTSSGGGGLGSTPGGGGGPCGTHGGGWSSRWEPRGGCRVAAGWEGVAFCCGDARLSHRD